MNGHRALTAECLLALMVVSIARIREQKKAPTPSQLAGVFMAYLLLSALALFGDQASRLAAGLGGLLLLSLFLAHGSSFFSGVAGLTAPSKVSLDGSAAGRSSSFV